MNRQRNLIILVYFTLFMGLGAFFPFMSIYLKDTLHFNGEQIGLFYSLSSLIVVISVPFFGILADKIRSAKTVFVLCALATVVFLIPFTMLKGVFIMTFLYVIINGLRSVLVPMTDTLSIEYQFKYSGNYGFFRSVGSFSFIMSSILTGFLLERFDQYSALFLYIHIVFLILCAFFASRLENNHVHTNDNISIINHIKDLLKNKKYLLIIFIMAIANGLVQLSQSYISLAVMELGGSSQIVGLSVFFLVIPEVIFYSFVLKWAKKLSHMHLILFGCLYLLLRWIVLFFTNSLPILLIFSTGHGIVMAFVVLVGIDLIKLNVKPNLISSAISVYTGLSYVFFAVISFGTGMIMGNDGSVKNTYLLYIVTTLCAIVGIIIYMYKYQR
ncbi:MAG: MFS transporter, partial [Erysipelotrichales bacterium]